MIIFKNADINGVITDIEVDDGRFVRIGKTDKDGIDLGGNSVFPGLVDIHCHGCMGYDTMDGIYLNEMSEYQALNGVTSWFPTTMTMDYESIKRVVSIDINKIKGANVLGFHLEGPYIAPEFKGAQNGEFIRNPDMEEYRKWDNARLVTIAPELCGATEFIKECDGVVCIGHTGAEYETASAAIQAGANCLTHTFNAMPPLHHRNPGVIGAAIDNDAYVQVICDGIHIHKSVITALYRIFGKKMILISDSMRAAGMPDGEYELGGQQMTVENGIAKTPDGAIAGSTFNLFKCVRKAIEFGIAREDAFYMASTAPSELMGINKGKIKEGFDADFIVVDKDNNLLKTIIGGNEIK